MRVFAIILLCFLFIDASAQNKEDVLYQDIILSCYDVLNEYERNCSFSNEERVSEFKDMFESSSNLHTNDIPAMNNYNNDLSISNYIKSVRNYYNSMNVYVVVNSFSNVEYYSDQAEISVFINKSISGTNIKNSYEIKTDYFIIKKDDMYLSYAGKYVSNINDAITYDSRDEAKEKKKKLEKIKLNNEKFKIETIEDISEEFVSYVDNFNLKMDFIFKINSDSVFEARIKKVDLVDKKDPLVVILPTISKWHSKKNSAKKEYIFDMDLLFSNEISKKSSRKSKWKKKKLNGYFHSLNNVGKTKVKPKNKLYYKTLIIDPQNENLTETGGVKELNFKKYTTTLAGYLIFPSNNINFLSNSYSSSFVINQLDLTNNYKLKAEYKLFPRVTNYFVYAGINYSKNLLNHNILIDNYNFSYNDFDLDGAEYLRIIELNNIVENQIIDTESFYASLLIGREFNFFNKSFSLSFSIGGWTNENYNILSAKYNSYADALYSGYYEDLAGITISENGVYDFGDYQISDSGSIIEPSKVNSMQYQGNLSFKISNNFALSLNYSLTTFNDAVFNFGDTKISKNFNELNSVMNISPIDMQQSNWSFGINYSF
jgi:hypothetical protein